MGAVLGGYCISKYSKVHAYGANCYSVLLVDLVLYPARECPSESVLSKV